MDNPNVLLRKITLGRIVGWVFVALYGGLATLMFAIGQPGYGVFLGLAAAAWLIAAVAAHVGAWGTARPIYTVVGVLTIPLGGVMFGLGRAMCRAGEELDDAGGIRAIRGVERAQAILRGEQLSRHALIDRMVVEGFGDVNNEVFRVKWGAERCERCNQSLRTYMHFPITFCANCDSVDLRPAADGAVGPDSHVNREPPGTTAPITAISTVPPVVTAPIGTINTVPLATTAPSSPAPSARATAGIKEGNYRERLLNWSMRIFIVSVVLLIIQFLIFSTATTECGAVYCEEKRYYFPLILTLSILGGFGGFIGLIVSLIWSWAHRVQEKSLQPARNAVARRIDEMLSTGIPVADLHEGLRRDGHRANLIDAALATAWDFTATRCAGCGKGLRIFARSDVRASAPWRICESCGRIERAGDRVPAHLSQPTSDPVPGLAGTHSAPASIEASSSSHPGQVEPELSGMEGAPGPAYVLSSAPDEELQESLPGTLLEGADSAQASSEASANSGQVQAERASAAMEDTLGPAYVLASVQDEEVPEDSPTTTDAQFAETPAAIAHAVSVPSSEPPDGGPTTRTAADRVPSVPSLADGNFPTETVVEAVPARAPFSVPKRLKIGMASVWGVGIAIAVTLILVSALRDGHPRPAVLHSAAAPEVTVTGTVEGGPRTATSLAGSPTLVAAAAVTPTSSTLPSPTTAPSATTAPPGATPKPAVTSAPATSAPTTAPAAFCAAGQVATSLGGQGGFPCPDSVTVEKSTATPVGGSAPPATADTWIITVRYHWVGQLPASGQQAQYSFLPIWPAGCLQVYGVQNLTVVIAESGVVTTNYSLGRANASCAPGTYTSNGYVIRMFAVPTIMEGASIRTFWGVSGTQGITMTVR